jgi:hypothetical protein
MNALKGSISIFPLFTPYVTQQAFTQHLTHMNKKYQLPNSPNHSIIPFHLAISLLHYKKNAIQTCAAQYNTTKSNHISNKFSNLNTTHYQQH